MQLGYPAPGRGYVVDDIGSYNAERRRSAFGEIKSMRSEDMAVATLAGHEIKTRTNP